MNARRTAATAFFAVSAWQSSRASAQVVGAPDTAASSSSAASASPAATLAPTSHDVVPPKAIATRVDYPRGADAPAEVVIEVTIAPDGSVTEARVVVGASPFDVAAQEAARHWRFEPARRDGRAVAARIRHLVRFTPPAPDVPVAPSPLPPSSATTPHPRAPEPVEVTVRGGKPLGSVTVTRSEARNLPGSFGDPLRAIESQPGVLPIVSGVPSFYIRGAPPANVGFFIDGVDVPLLYHAFLGPSVIHPGLIESVDLYRGASPVEYGRFAGPIVAANMQPMQHRWTGEGNLRLIDVGALLEAPFGGCDGADVPGCSRGSARVSGRYSYTSLVLSLLTSAELQYWDYQGEVSYALGTHDTVSVLGFGAYDLFRTDTGAVEQQGGKVDFHRLDLRWDHKMAGGSALRVAITGGADHSGGADASESEVTDKSLRARVQLKQLMGARVTLHAGVDARIDKFGLETSPLYLRYTDYAALFGARVEEVAGAYAGLDVQAAQGVNVSPGVRTDVYHSGPTTRLAVDPRVIATFDVHPNLRVDQSLAIAHQRPNFAAQVPGAQVADLAGGLQEGWLWSAGVRWRWPSNTTFTGALYRSGYFHALDPIGSARDFSIDRTVLDRRSTITASGIELGVSRPLTRTLGGFISYTFSHSETSSGSHRTVSGFDRPHMLQAALSYDAGRGYRVGVRTVFYSGIPELNLEGSPHFSGDRRGAPFLRVDLRLEKRWRVGDTGWWSAVAEVLNATSSSEVVRLDCGTVCVQRRAGPIILPSLGVEAGF